VDEKATDDSVQPEIPTSKVEPSAPKKWREFEDLAASIQKQFVGADATVTTNDHIRGRRTGDLRQIDITIRQRVGQFEMLVVIDCKDYKTPVDVKDVEAFIGLLEDVAGNKGVIIAARGFTSGAKKRAADARIEILTLVDAGSTKWPLIPAIPVVVANARIKNFQLRFSGIGPTVLPAVEDFRRLALYRADGTKIGLIGNLLIRRWTEAAIPHAAGTYEGVLLTEEPTWVETDGVRYPMSVAAVVNVEVDYFFKMLPLAETQGFKNEITGGYTTRSMKTSVIDLEKVESEWERITEAEAGTRPITMRLEGSSVPEAFEDSSS
jgi:hypothetical protein